MTSTTNNIDFLALDGELDLDELDAVMSGGREKGQYKQDLLGFIESGKMAVPYKFQGKKAASVKTGFESAVDSIEKDAEIDDATKAAAKELYVKVKKVGDGEDAQELVFLVRQDIVRERKGLATA